MASSPAPGPPAAAAGVDVGARRLHAVVLAGPAVAWCGAWPAADPGGLARHLAGLGVTRAAVDAPAAPSTAPHAALTEGSPPLARKFATARCGEIALGRGERVWVPWPAPAAPPFPAWMQAGFDVFAALAAAGIDAVETYPHAVFRALGGAHRPPKRTPAGREARLAALVRAGVGPGPSGIGAVAGSHDLLDAAAAGVVAADPAARRVSCDHDDSAIWLPSAPC